ncbi:hypothetical protein ZWY2020_051795 [Hordeum vulgare]|nr:hypothetical protein ZWY2020_051795 [Hordeum vulgare]
MQRSSPLPVMAHYVISSAAVALMFSASWQSLPGGSSRAVRMRLFMHEVRTGPGATAMAVVNGTGPVVLLGDEPPMRFGQVVVMDDALTEGPSSASRPVGRAHGFSSLRDPALLFSMNVVLAEGPHSRSTFVAVGRDNMVAPLRVLSVVSGTGRFRMATVRARVSPDTRKEVGDG